MDAQAGLRHCCSPTPEERFSRVEAHMNWPILTEPINIKKAFVYLVLIHVFVIFSNSFL